MKVMFLDESGDHKLTRSYHRYPIFVLGGAIVERSYVRDVIEPEMNQFKRRYFGRDDVVLHTVNMRNGTGDYAFLAVPNILANFYRDLNSLLQRWEYKMDLRDKKPNLAGLQLADLVVTPIGRYVMGQAPRPYEVN